MIAASKAYELIMQHTGNWGIEEISFDQSVGRILREDIKADRDFPPFDRVTMDGIGISYSKGKNEFRVVDLQAAGMPRKSLEDAANCMEVMTGAICPNGIDTIIPYENIEIIDKMATVKIPVKQGKNVHYQGFDKKTGDILVPQGKKISTAEIGVIASVGKSSLKVSTLPRVAILSTGDELLNVEEVPSNYQIRKSNVWALKTDLLEMKIDADMFHLADSKEKIKDELSHILKNYDVVLLSGGVSKGKLDYIPEVMESLGIEKIFHRVKQRPGKPFWFGNYQNKVQLFAFPGNPVSTYAGFHRYFIPWLNKSMEMEEQPAYKLKLTEEFNFDLALEYFLQVKIVQTSNGPQAKPIKGKGSGDHANLLATDGFLVIPEEVNHCPVDSEFDYIPFRKIGL